MGKKNLKDKTINGLLWSFFDHTGDKLVQFIFAIILARILTPNDFGLIGILGIFIVFSETIVDSGLSTALIRKTKVTDIEYSTVFYFNITLSVFFYISFFFLSPLIGSFFNQQILVGLIKVWGLSLIINSFGIVQRTILIRNIDFKTQTKISFISSLISGILGISLAYNGFGVWSLVYKTLSKNLVRTLLLWYQNNWIPSKNVSKKAFNELFNFGSKILLASLIDRIYQKVYYFIIGKYFSAASLGYYTRADQFKGLLSENLNMTIQRVTYPILSSIKNEPDRLKRSFQKIIKKTMFLSFFLMFGLAATAKAVVITLVGSKWITSVEYLQLLCFAGVLYPINSLNLSILNVKKRSDLFLKLEIIRKLLALPIIIAALFINIKAMILGMILNAIVEFFVNSNFAGKLINYTTSEQIKDILPSFIFTITVSSIVFLSSIFFKEFIFLTLVMQIFISIIVTIILGEILIFDEYIEIKKIIKKVFAF